MQPRVAVVILNWNGKALLEQFLPSVITHTINATIYVVDNNSTDCSQEFLENNFPSIKVLKHGQNLGFAEGYNKALFQLDEEIFVLLNSDVEVTANWLNPLVEFLNQNPNVACCQPKIKDFYKKTHFEYAGAAGGYIDKYGYPFCQGRIFNTLEEDIKQYDEAKEIFWASGACMVIRSSVYKEINGLDKSFFAHMEEIDLCWRIINRGYQIFYCPESTVYHIGGGTLNKVQAKKTYLNFRNSLVMLLKNLHSREVFLIFFTRLVLDGVAGVKFLLEGKPAHCFAIVRAHFYCYFNIRTIVKQRQNKTSKELRNISTIFRTSIIYQYFILKRRKYGDLKIPNSTSASS
jgi:GT2 family glycosyltransferase